MAFNVTLQYSTISAIGPGSTYSNHYNEEGGTVSSIVLVSSLPSWLNVTLDTSNYSLQVVTADNPNYSTRSSNVEVRFYSTGGEYSDVSFTVNQASASIRLVPSSTTIDSNGGTVTSTVSGVSTWSATSNTGWLTASKSGNILSVVVASNSSSSDRSGTVTVTSGILSSTFTVTQYGRSAQPTITLNTSEATVGPGINTVVITYTVTNYSGSVLVSDNPSWISSSRSGNNVTFVVAANDTGASRYHDYTFSAGTATATVRINQNAYVFDKLTWIPSGAVDSSSLAQEVTWSWNQYGSNNSIPLSIGYYDSTNYSFKPISSSADLRRLTTSFGSYFTASIAGGVDDPGNYYLYAYPRYANNGASDISIHPTISTGSLSLDSDATLRQKADTATYVYSILVNRTTPAQVINVEADTSHWESIYAYTTDPHGGSWDFRVGTDTWLMVSPGLYTGGYLTCSLEYSPNTSTSSRSCWVTCSYEVGTSVKATKYFKVIQKGAAGITIDHTTGDFTKDGGTDRVTINTVNYTGNIFTSSSTNWLSANVYETSTNRKVYDISASANPTFTERSATMTFSLGTGASVSYTASQARNEYEISVSPSSLTFNNAASSKTVNITTNSSSVETETSDSSWLTVGATTTVGTVTVTANPNPTPRTGIIKFKVKNTYGNYITSSVSVTQTAGASTLTLTPSSKTFNNTGETTSLTLVTNQNSWSLASSSNWITATPSSGTSKTASISIVASKNNTGTSRTAYLTTTLDGVSSNVFTATQGAFNETFSLSPNVLTITHSVSEGTLTYSTNKSNWTLNSGSASWIKFNPSSKNEGSEGAHTGIISYTASAYTGSGTRSGTLTTTLGGNVSTVLNFNQTAQPVPQITYAQSTGGTIEGPGTVAYGGSITVLTYPESGYTLQGLSINPANAGTVSGTTISNIVANLTVIPSWQSGTGGAWTITYVQTEGGVITGPGSANDGATINVSFVPNTGYVLSSWLIQGDATKSDADKTISNIHSNIVVIPTFVPGENPGPEDAPEINQMGFIPMWLNTNTVVSTGSISSDIIAVVDNSYILVDEKYYSKPGQGQLTVSLNKLAESVWDAPTWVTSTSVRANRYLRFVVGSKTDNVFTSIREYRANFVPDWSYSVYDYSTYLGLSHPVTDKVVVGQYLPYTTIRTTSSSTTFQVISPSGTSTRTVTGNCIQDHIININQEGTWIINGNRFTTTYADYVLYFVDSWGGWNSLPLEGRTLPSRDYDRYSVSNEDRYTSNYKTNVTKKYLLRTGWMSDEQATLMYNVFGSTNTVLHDLINNRVFSVNVVSNTSEDKTYHNQGNSLVRYEIEVEDKELKVRR